MSVMDSGDMDSNVVGIAAFLFILADLEVSIRDVHTPLVKNLRFDYKLDWFSESNYERNSIK